MFKYEVRSIVGLIFAIAALGTIGIFIFNVIIMLAKVFAGVAAAGGTLYGVGYAIKNYFFSFKENVIDSNKAPAMAA